MSAKGAGASAKPRPAPAGAEPLQVTCPAGEFVRLRAAPSTSAATVLKLRPGQRCEPLATRGAWTQLRVGTRVGWMMSAFLIPVDGEEVSRRE